MPTFKTPKNALSQKKYKALLKSGFLKQLADEMFAKQTKLVPITNPNILLKNIKKGYIFRQMKKELTPADFDAVEKMLDEMKESDKTKYEETMKKLSSTWLLCKYIYWLNFACTSEKWKVNESAYTAFESFKEKWVTMALNEKLNNAKEMFDNKKNGLHYFRTQRVQLTQ